MKGYENESYLGDGYEPPLDVDLKYNGVEPPMDAAEPEVDPSSAPAGHVTTVYVGNLRGKLQSEALERMFSPFGAVERVQMFRNFAFLHMRDACAAKAAIAALNNSELDGNRIVVEVSLGRKKVSRNLNEVNIFVGRAKDVDDAVLKTLFEAYGPVSSIERPRSKPEVAFVRMESFFDARKAIDALDRKRVESLPHPLVVEIAENNVTPKGRRIKSLIKLGEITTVYIKGLTDSCKEKDLTNLFEKYGPVWDGRVIKGKGYGFVDMLCPTSANEAVSALNRSEFQGIKLTVNLSHNKTSSARSGLSSSSSLNPRIKSQSSLRTDPIRQLASIKDLLELQQQIQNLNTLFEASGGLRRLSQELPGYMAVFSDGDRSLLGSGARVRPNVGEFGEASISPMAKRVRFSGGGGFDRIGANTLPPRMKRF